jgi:hypothetical protein
VSDEERLLKDRTINLKSQITNIKQIQINKSQLTNNIGFGILEFGVYLYFGACYLFFPERSEVV